LWLATFWGYMMGFGAVALFYFLMLIIVLALRQPVSAALEEKLKEKLND
jgi:galactitol-specific phosphotransferase system IIC component